MGSVDLVKKIEQERGKKWVKKIRSWEHKSVKADIIYWQQEVNNLKQCLDGSSQILS
jgi:hypothetical protein